MKIAVFQGAPGVCENAERVALLARSAHAAAMENAALLVLPELFVSGYNVGRDALHERAEAADGPIARRIGAIARDAGIAILYGYPERAGDAVFNAAQLIDGSGQTLANHRKTHLFGEVERATFTSGETSVTMATVAELRLAILICYEVEFPECVRLPALAGADLIAVPTALMAPYAFVAQTLIPARAIENQVFVAYANYCGAEDNFRYTGMSCIIAPDGTDLARAGDRQELLVAALDPSRLARSRQHNRYLSDRRPELYAGLAEPTPCAPPLASHA